MLTRHWPTVWVDVKEPLLLLGVLGDVDLGELIRESGQDVVLIVMAQDRLCVVSTDPSSSKVMEILMPLGVWVVYRWMLEDMVETEDGIDSG